MVDWFGWFDAPAADFGEGGVGVLVVAVVRESCVANTERVVVPEIRGTIANLVKAFDCNGGDKLGGAEVREGGGGVGWGGD